MSDRQAHNVFLSVVGIAAQHLTESRGGAPNSRFPWLAEGATLRRGEFPIADAYRPAPMLSLREVVDRYLVVAGTFGQPVALCAFKLSSAEIQALFNVLDEDYHLSRFLHFSRVEGEAYLISGDRVTHLSIDPGIQSIL
ncbi:MAG: hypothetical protein WCE53_01255 [Candidatus Acidiferrum sp.]